MAAALSSPCDSEERGRATLPDRMRNEKWKMDRTKRFSIYHLSLVNIGEFKFEVQQLADPSANI